MAYLRDRPAGERLGLFASVLAFDGNYGIVILVVSVWAVRRVTAPLAAVSSCRTVGKDMNASPMPETGTIETRQASRAFNTMQARLRSLIENRTRMLAAISHDLRTPLTLLRLRVENVKMNKSETECWRRSLRWTRWSRNIEVRTRRG